VELGGTRPRSPVEAGAASMRHRRCQMGTVMTNRWIHRHKQSKHYMLMMMSVFQYSSSAVELDRKLWKDLENVS